MAKKNGWKGTTFVCLQSFPRGPLVDIRFTRFFAFSLFQNDREVTEYQLLLTKQVVDAFSHEGNARLDFVFQGLSTCNTTDFPSEAAMVFALVQSSCAQQLDASWREGDPPMIWHANEKLPPRRSSNTSLSHFFMVDEPTLSRYDLLRRLVSALALEKAILVTDDPDCGAGWEAGPVYCVSGELLQEDAVRIKELRSPVIVLDMYVMWEDRNAQGPVSTRNAFAVNVTSSRGLECI